MTAPSPYLGGKRDPLIRARVAGLLEGCRFYCEPFMGSMAMLFGMEPRPVEILNDLYGPTVLLARVLRDPASAVALFDRVSPLLCHPETFTWASGLVQGWAHRLDEFLDDDALPAYGVDAWLRDRVEFCAAYLVCAWMGPGDRVGTDGWPASAYYAKRNTAGGGSTPKRWAGVSASLPWWHERLRGVEFRREDGLGLIAAIEDKPGWAIYADPPYIEQGEQYAVADGWGSSPMFLGANHTALAGVLNAKRSTRVVVSYYADDRLRDLYPPDRWSILDASKSKASGNARGSGRRSSPEVLIVNVPGLVRFDGAVAVSGG